MGHNQSHPLTEKCFLLAAFTSVFFPLFPTIFGNAPIHLVVINIGLGVLLLATNYNRSIRLNNLLFSWMIIFCVQFGLLCISLIQDSLNQSVGFISIFSTLKPLYTLFFLFIGYSLAFSYEQFERIIGTYFKLIIIISLIVASYEIFFIQNGSLFYSLYKSEERYILGGKSTSWFGVSYYHSFYFLLFFVYYFICLIKRSQNLLPALASFTLVVASQSRTLILSMLIFIIIIVLFELIKKPKAILKIGISILLFFSLLSVFSEEIINHFWYVTVVFESLASTGFIEFILKGSIGVRIEQIISSIDMQHYIIGVGLGGKGVPLESIYASYFYRFGLVWGLICVLFYIFIGFYLINSARGRLLYTSVGYFWIMTPISMFASPMIDFPKINFIIFLITGYLIKNTIRAI